LSRLLRQLGARDAALIVMGGIIGSGIFKTPSVVAARVHGGWLVLAAWIAGGVIALLGAFVFAELAARRPRDGGFYAYLRDAFHPVVAFSYGWTLLLVSQSGGAAVAAVTFADYTGVHVDHRLLAAAAIAVFTAINLLGVRAGTSVQNWLMTLKIATIAGLVVLGFIAPPSPHAVTSALAFPPAALAVALGFAMVPVLFSYDGYQTASFMSAELRDPERTLPRGLIYGVLLVVALYVGVNFVCLRVLGAARLAATPTPVSDIARLALGPIGERIMAGIVILSTLGFLANQILTSPRIFYQMAADGIFFKSLAWVDRRTHVPSIAIAVQGAAALVIALSGSYNQILNYVSSVDFVFFGLGALALFVFRARDRDGPRVRPSMPGHPWTTSFYLAVSWLLVIDLVIASPYDSLIGLGILLSSIPVYAFFAMRNSRATTPPLSS
jgi:basic amino acid/polyamine antiporter, APA family